MMEITSRSNQDPVSPQFRPGEDGVGDSIHLVDLLIVVARQKKLILGLPFVLALAAAGLSLLVPNVYTAQTRLLPPQQSQSGAAALLSQLGGAASMAAGVAGLKNPSDLYVGMLRSRSVADMVIADNKLVQIYGTESADETRLRLEQRSDITAGKDGFITVSVEDRDKKLAAQLANSYASALTKLTRTLALTEASQRRMFFEQQLETSKNNLATAEVALKRALDSRGVISVDVDSRSVLGTIGQLRARISAKEIELGSMRPFLTSSNPDFKRVEEELNSLRLELSKLENGKPDNGELPEAKQVGLENIKLLRDVKYQQMLYELLAKQYEYARLEEAKDPSVIQVLDRAIEPERKSKPKRAVIVLLTAVLGLFAALFIAFFKEARRNEAQHEALKWNELKAQLRRWRDR